MSLLVAFLAVSGALLWVAIAGAVIFGVFFSAASAEDRATVDLPDVDVTDRLEPFVNVRVLTADRPRPTANTTTRHLRVLGSGGWSTSHDPASCDACAGLDRGGF